MLDNKEGIYIFRFNRTAHAMCVARVEDPDDAAAVANALDEAHPGTWHGCIPVIWVEGSDE